MPRWVFAALLALGIASPALAANTSNLELFKAASNAINRYERFTIFDTVHLGVQDGTVTLTGKVTMPYKATDIENRVARIDGVQRVVNHIEVLPVSLYDEQLRERAARAIYSNPVLFQYGLGPSPSIHIIVERGRLTLDGVVARDMDRQVARSVVGYFGAFSITNDLKTDEEIEQELEKL
jgi:BON domain